jgi:hypothetical protein
VAAVVAIGRLAERVLEVAAARQLRVRRKPADMGHLDEACDDLPLRRVGERRASRASHCCSRRSGTADEMQRACFLLASR